MQTDVSIRPVREHESAFLAAWRQDNPPVFGARRAGTELWSLGDEPPPLWILDAAQPLGLAVFHRIVHPAGLHGEIFELELSGGAQLLDVLSEVLRGLESVLKASAVVDTLVLVSEQSAASFVGRLKDAGFEPHRSGHFLREFTSTFWRRGRVFVIAEAGSNWRMGTPRRDREMAFRLIDEARAADADAVKFQTFRPETIYVEGAGASDYLTSAGISQSMSEIFADLAMPYEMVGELAQHAREQGIGFMSTAFSPADFAAVDPHVGIHKIASYEISHPRLIELAAMSGKPTVMSTGAAMPDDIDWAVRLYRACGGRDLCLLQCTAKYPAPSEALNLRAIPWLRRRFSVSAGLSDHSREASVAPVAAVALGARVVEKHFTLDNRLPGPDHAFAITAEELRHMVSAIRRTELSLGAGGKAVHEAEAELAAFAQRALQVIAPIAPGDVLAEGRNIDILRPGKQSKGVHPRHLAEIEGKHAARRLRIGEGLRHGDWTA